MIKTQTGDHGGDKMDTNDRDRLFRGNRGKIMTPFGFFSELPGIHYYAGDHLTQNVNCTYKYEPCIQMLMMFFCLLCCRGPVSG